MQSAKIQNTFTRNSTFVKDSRKFCLMNKPTSKTFQPKLLKYIMTVRRRRKLCKDNRHLTIYSSVRKWRGVVNSSYRSGVKSSTKRCGIISLFFLQHTSTSKTTIINTLDNDYTNEIKLSWAIPLTKIHCDNMEAQQLVKWAASNYTMLSEKTSVNLLESALPKTTRQPALLLVSTGTLNPSGNHQVPVFSSGYQTQQGLHIKWEVRKGFKQIYFIFFLKSILARHDQPSEDHATIYYCGQVTSEALQCFTGGV